MFGRTNKPTAHNTIQDFILAPFNVEEGRMLKLAVQTLEEHYGLDPAQNAKPGRAAKALWYQLGVDAATHVSSRDVYGVIDELAEIWRRSGIGTVRWRDRKRLLLEIWDKSNISGLKSPYCTLKKTLLEATMKEIFGKHIAISEVKCGARQSACILKIALSHENI